MKFYHQGQSINPPKEAVFPCLVLAKDNWDDYHYKTTFNAHYYPTSRKAVELGVVKILQRGEFSTDLSQSFEQLDDSYCSLWQSLDSYQKLVRFGPKVYSPILRNLNDVVFDRSIAVAFEGDKGFTTSLIRFSEAEKAYKEGALLFSRLAPRTKVKHFAFKFLCHVPGADASHEINLDFTPDRTELHRMIALIGKNGTGKTQVLAKLASAMSGWKKEAGEFIPDRPNFSKVIAISYSVFDRFERPEEGTETYSYIYCGIRRGERKSAEPHNSQGDEIYTQQEIEEKLLTALKQVDDAGRSGQWSRVLSELLEDQVTVKDLRTRDGKLKYSVYNRFSSGQSILIRLMTEVIANIAKESIVLFDEPEIHLHPDALSALIRAFHLLLEEFDSYAVVATHSPIILQQIPARRVRVFKREGSFPIVTQLGIECFGENLTVITNEVFETSDLYSNYQDHLRDLANSYTYEEILGFFNGRLGLNAKAFLRSLYDSTNVRTRHKR